MNSVVRDIRESLCSAGWVEVSAGSQEHLDLVLKHSFAAVGVLCSRDGSDALQRWILAQAELSELRETLGRNRDLYLLICVPEIDVVTMEQLPTVIGDTHVCRKLVIELRNRPADEALLDVPLLIWQTPENGSDDLEYASLPESVIPPHLVDDLGRKSPGRVLDAWLEGQYDRVTDDAD